MLCLRFFFDLPISSETSVAELLITKDIMMSSLKKMMRHEQGLAVMCWEEG